MNIKKFLSVLFAVLMCIALVSLGAFAAEYCSHSFSDWVLTKEATCDDYGKYERTCSLCGTTEESSIAPKNHKWDAGVIDAESTCVTQGKRTYTCLNNENHTYTVLLPLNKDAHIKETYTIGEIKASCTSAGFTGRIFCDGCDTEISKGNVIPAIGTHTFEEFPLYSESRDVKYTFGGKNLLISEANVVIGEHSLLNKYFRIRSWMITPLESMDLPAPIAKGVLALPVPEDYNNEKIKVFKLDLENDVYTELTVKEITDGYAYVNTDTLGIFTIAETTYMWEITHAPTMFETGVKRLQCRRCNGYKVESVPKLRTFVAEDVFSGISITYPKEYFGNQIVELAVNSVYLGEHALTKQYSQITVNEVEAVAGLNTVEPSGEFKIRIPVPSDYDKESIIVYYLNTEDGSYTPVEIVNDVAADGYAEMVVSYLGIFAVVDTASENPYLNCECLCHQKGLLKIIFKVLLDIQKFFGINDICECGAIHYEKTEQSIFDKLFPNGVIPPVK